MQFKEQHETCKNYVHYYFLFTLNSQKFHPLYTVIIDTLNRILKEGKISSVLIDDNDDVTMQREHSRQATSDLCQRLTKTADWLLTYLCVIPKRQPYLPSI
jgi:hypothetical protein